MRTYYLIEVEEDYNEEEEDDFESFYQVVSEGDLAEHGEEMLYCDEADGYTVYGLPFNGDGTLKEEILSTLSEIEEEYDSRHQVKQDVLDLLRKAFPEHAKEIAIELIPLYYPTKKADEKYHFPVNPFGNVVDMGVMMEEYDSYGNDVSQTLEDNVAHTVEVNRYIDLDEFHDDGNKYHLYPFFHGGLYTVVKIDGAKPSENEKYLYVTTTDWEGPWRDKQKGHLIGKDERKKLLAGKPIN